MLFLFVVLSNNSMNNSFQNIFLWDNTFHIFDKVISICSLIILKIINYQIESSLWNDINKWRENLKSIFSSSKNNQIVSQKIIVLKDISHRWRVLESLELSLSCLTVVELEVITSFEINTNNRVWIKT